MNGLEVKWSKSQNGRIAVSRIFKNLNIYKILWWSDPSNLAKGPSHNLTLHLESPWLVISQRGQVIQVKVQVQKIVQTGLGLGGEVIQVRLGSLYRHVNPKYFMCKNVLYSKTNGKILKPSTKQT